MHGSFFVPQKWEKGEKMKTLLFVENAKALENINYQLEFMERQKIETVAETEYPRYFRVLKKGLKEVTTERGKQLMEDKRIFTVLPI